MRVRVRVGLRVRVDLRVRVRVRVRVCVYVPVCVSALGPAESSALSNMRSGWDGRVLVEAFREWRAAPTHLL
eukprot:14955796-Alexandrium_andersonii.AAC.1